MEHEHPTPATCGIRIEGRDKSRSPEKARACFAYRELLCIPSPDGSAARSAAARVLASLQWGRERGGVEEEAEAEAAASPGVRRFRPLVAVVVCDMGRNGRLA